MKITKELCLTARGEMEKTLNESLGKLGLKVNIGSMSYNPESFTCKIECIAIPEGIDAKDPEAVAKAEFKRNAPRFGGKAEWFGQLTVIDGKPFRVVGIKTSAKKNAFLIQQDGSDTKYVTSAESVRFGIEMYQRQKAGK